MVTGVSSGLATTTISYSVSTFSCGNAAIGHAVTVKALPNAGTISGPGNVCYGATISLSDAAPSGTWSSSSTSVATVTSGGVVSGASVTLASATINYTVPSFSCGSAIATQVVTVNPYPNAGTISGPSVVCEASQITLSDATGVGVWSSSQVTVATVGLTGVVRGILAGNATISYTVTNTCGSTSALFAVTVNPLPVAGTITGADTVCESAFTLLSDLAPGGSWASGNNLVATVSGGLVGGVSGGITGITYTVTNGCGTTLTSVNVTVNPLPLAGSITGASAVCELSSITLSDATPGGSWSSGNNLRAGVTTTGVVNGISAGSVTISYTVTNSCGVAYATKLLTVNPLPVAGTIIGSRYLCPGTTLSFSNLTPLGTWSSGSAGIATVSATGLVGGVTAGDAVISYSVTNICGTAIDTQAVTVIPFPLPGSIGGSSLACPGAATTLTETTFGGTWTSNNLPVATINGSGVVFGVSPGTTTIRYTVTNFCGSAFTTHPMTVNPIVVPSVTTTLSPNDTVCGGSLVTFTALPVNGGPSPTYIWTNFGSAIGSGNPFSYSPANGDQVNCIMISSAPCPVPVNDTATPIGMTVFPVVTPVISIISSAPHDSLGFVGEVITFNSTSTYGGTAPTFQWYVNGVAIPGATTISYTSVFETSDTVYCVMISNLPCTADSTDTSNVIHIIGDYLDVRTMGTVINNIGIFPNPNTGSFLLKGIIHSDSNEPVHYDVLDMMGKVIYSDRTVPQNGIIEQQINLIGVASGQYVLRVIKENESRFLRFVVMPQQ